MYRILYRKNPTDPNILTSDVLTAENGALYRVKLDLSKGAYYIKNLRSGDIVARKEGLKHPTYLKRAVKKKLMYFGVFFGIETRLTKGEHEQFQIN